MLPRNDANAGAAKSTETNAGMLFARRFNTKEAKKLNLGNIYFLPRA